MLADPPNRLNRYVPKLSADLGIRAVGSGFCSGLENRQVAISAGPRLLCGRGCAP